jgi:uncharacterized protein YidB (DUF937 family)
MGLFDDLTGAVKGALGQAETAALPELLSRVLGKTDLGSISGLLEQLQAGGLGPQVSSWLGDGANQPIGVDQLRAALGNSHLGQMASSMGLPTDQLLSMLSQHLPNLIDRMSPAGQLQGPGA